MPCKFSRNLKTIFLVTESVFSFKCKNWKTPALITISFQEKKQELTHYHFFALIFSWYLPKVMHYNGLFWHYSAKIGLLGFFDFSWKTTKCLLRQTISLQIFKGYLPQIFHGRFLITLTQRHLWTICFTSKKATVFVTLCTIWHHLYNLKNVKNTHGGVLLLVGVSLQLY